MELGPSGSRSRRHAWSRPDPRRPIALVVGVLASGLATTGCTADAEPAPTPVAPSTTVTPSATVAAPSTTVTAAPSPVGPVPPVEAPVPPAETERTDEVGAIAAAEYFMELYAYTFASGDSTEWERISGQTCGFCTSTLDIVERVYGDGGHFTGGEFTTSHDTSVVGFDEQLIIYGVQVQFERAGGQQVARGGEVVRELPPEGGYIVLDVAPSTRGWLLMEGSAQDGPIQ